MPCEFIGSSDVQNITFPWPTSEILCSFLSCWLMGFWLSVSYEMDLVQAASYPLVGRLELNIEVERSLVYSQYMQIFIIKYMDRHIGRQTTEKCLLLSHKIVLHVIPCFGKREEMLLISMSFIVRLGGFSCVQSKNEIF